MHVKPGGVGCIYEGYRWVKEDVWVMWVVFE